MTVVQYVEYILRENWLEDVEGRVNPVPKPEITREKLDSYGRLRNKDIVSVIDGGSYDYDPNYLGYEARDEIGRVSVIIRTTHSRERFEGERDENNVGESYGGLIGEIRRILDLKRKGDQEWDLVKGSQFNDNSGNYGRGQWRGSFEIVLDKYASEIDPPTS